MNYTRVMEDSLLARTYRLLQATPMSYREIALEARVGFEWLKKFGTKAIGEPGVEKVQRVHDVLAERSCAAAPRRSGRKSTDERFHALTQNE